MPYINFVTPPFPHFILAGDALYRPGDAHRQRVNIGLFDLIFVEYGELFITDANMPYHLRENDVLIIRPDAMHFGHKSVSVKTKFKWLHFRTVGEYNYSNEIRLIKGERHSLYSYDDRKSQLTLPIYKKLSPLEGNEFSVCFSKLISANIDKYQQKEDQGQTPLSPLECQELFLKLLNFIQVSYPQMSSSELLAVSIMEYIMQNYHLPLTLENIAEHFNFHPTHIIRCLKKEYGITPNKALNGIRIENAKKLLITSDLSISKISFYVGFATPSYFNRIFKEYTGETPKEFRMARS